MAVKNVCKRESKEIKKSLRTEFIISYPSSKRIKINVNGTKFQTELRTIQSHPNFLLSRWLKGSFIHPDLSLIKKETIIKRDPTYFPQILEFLRTNNCNFLPTKEPLLKAILKEANFYKLKPLQKSIQSALNRLKTSAEFVHCSNCIHKICDISKALHWRSRRFHSFQNSEARHYSVFLMKEIDFKAVGEVRKEFSWFSGCSWRIVSCVECEAHLGWRFERDGNEEESGFDEEGDGLEGLKTFFAVSFSAVSF